MCWARVRRFSSPAPAVKLGRAVVGATTRRLRWILWTIALSGSRRSITRPPVVTTGARESDRSGSPLAVALIRLRPHLPMFHLLQVRHLLRRHLRLLFRRRTLRRTWLERRWRQLKSICRGRITPETKMDSGLSVARETVAQTLRR